MIPLSRARTQTEVEMENTKDDEVRLLSVPGLSKYLSIPKATIYTWVSLGRIPSNAIIRLGRSLKFDRRGIDEWISGQGET